MADELNGDEVEAVLATRACLRILQVNGIFEPETVAQVGMDLLLWSLSLMKRDKSERDLMNFRKALVYQLRREELYEIKDDEFRAVEEMSI